MYRRWKILLPEEVKLLQAAAQIKKTALISNFVDRESERPAIGPNDFTPLINSNTMFDKIGGAKVRKKKQRYCSLDIHWFSLGYSVFISLFLVLNYICLLSLEEFAYIHLENIMT